MNEYDNFMQTIENSYKETDDGDFSYLSVILTPMDLLKSDERFTRAKLYQIDSGEIILDVIHDRFNEKDNKSLEVYYDKTFIGYIRKRFDNEYIDNTELIDEFCFDGNKFRDIEMYWDSEEFFIKKESEAGILKRKIAEKEAELLDIVENHKNVGISLRAENEAIRNNKRIVLFAVSGGSNDLKYASERLKNDKEVVLAAVSDRGKALEFASEDLKNDKEIVLAAFFEDQFAAKYAGKDLKNDKSFITEAFKHNNYILEYASEELKHDKDFLLELGREEGGSIIKFASINLRDDKDFIMAFKNRGLEIGRISERLKNDKEIALASVSLYSDSIKNISEELRNDKEVVLTAIDKSESYNDSPLKHASENLKNDMEIVLAAVKKDSSAIQFLSEDLRNIKKIALIAVAKKGRTHDGFELPPLYFLNEKNQNDKEIVLLAVSADGEALRWASKELQNDKEVVLAALKENSYYAFKYASDELQQDPDIEAYSQ